MAKHQFQTEISQLLHLMTHSLYSNKEIFIRELISNASDALDKLNYLILTDENLKEKFSNWIPKINVKLDEKDKSITISDNGIGMDEEDLITSLGTIAKSGTKAFLEQISQNENATNNLIGQFGVGFYSVFMVAEKVDVISKKAGTEQAYKWSSDGKGEYELAPCVKDENGTVVYIKLKDEELEFTSKYTVENIIKKYSNHIAYPIFLHWSEEVEEELSEEDKKEGKTPEKKIENKTEQVNSAKALWTMNKKDIKDEEYIDFYKQISHDSEDPLDWIHTRAEGVNNYTTLFYIPKKAPIDMYRVDYTPGVKLYVKRVFITDDDKELLPSYLRFVRGIIDSDDLPLNVSREILQENKIMANIKQASIKKIISMIKKIKKDKEKYDIFTKEFNRPIKEGIYQDFVNKDALLEIVRYKSTKADSFTTLDEYIQRADSEQKTIYYIIGEDEKTLRNSPLLEAYKKNDIEVLICDDKEIDEIVTPAIGTYKEWEFKDITAIKPPKTQKSEEETKKIEEEFKPLVDKIKEILGDSVKDVRLSDRLVDSPSCVVNDENDPMAQMAAMMKAMGQELPKSKPILEINPEHKIVKGLLNVDEELSKDIAWVLLDQAKLAEGFEVDDIILFTKRLNKILEKVI